MGRGERHSQADTTIRKTSGRISEARQNGRQPQTPDIQERKDAITTREDIRDARRQERK